MAKKSLREKLKQGMPQLGMFIVSVDPAIVEIAAVAGMDFVVLDLEHGGSYYNIVEDMCRAADASEIDLIVRVPASEYNSVFRPLDRGATGVQVPQVNDVETAKRVAAATKYTPEGNRGAARTRQSRWGSVPDYFAKANARTVTAIHCETKECVNNIDAILSVPNIDVVFGGPMDLSHSYGMPGELSNPIVQKCIDTMLASAKKHGVAAGIPAYSPEDAKKRIEQGFTYVAFMDDQHMLLSALKSKVSAVDLKR